MTYTSGYQVLAREARKCAKQVDGFAGLVHSSYKTLRERLLQYGQRFNDAACAYEVLHGRHDTRDKTEHVREKEMKHLKEKMTAFEEYITAGEREFMHLVVRDLEQRLTCNCIVGVVTDTRRMNDGRLQAHLKQ